MTRLTTQHIRPALLALGAAAFFAVPARADELSLTTYCSSGTLKTCAAFRIMTTAVMGGGTDVMVWVANLAGVSPDNTTASFLSKFGFGLSAGALGTVSGFTAVADGASVFGSPESNWDVGTAANELSIGAGDFLGEVTTDPNKNGSIQGCTLSSNPSAYFKICGPNQFVKFSFTTSGSWSAKDALIAFKVQGAGTDGISLECIVGGTEDKACLPETTVPEPVTMGLIAIGLVGLAGVQFSRRRRKN